MRLLPLVAVVAAHFLPVQALRAQAAVEYTLGTARAAGAAGPMRGVGENVGGVFRSLSKTLEKAGAAQESAATSKAPATSTTNLAEGAVVTLPSSTSKIELKTVAAGKISAGMETAALIQEFGEPSMKTGSLWFYPRTGGGQWKLTVADGKVTKVWEAEPPRAANSQQVVVLK